MITVSRALLAMFALALAGCVVNTPPADTTHVVVQPETPAPAAVVVQPPPPPVVVAP
jgi:hypothetical protein